VPDEPTTIPVSPTPGLPAGVTVIPMYPMYSPGEITAATFFGGPIGGAWLLAINYRRLGEPRKARATIAIGVLALAALGGLGLLIESHTSSLGLASVVAMSVLARSLQSAAYERHIALGGPRASVWRAIGIGVAGLALSFAVIVGAALVYGEVTAPSELRIGKCAVLYGDDTTRAEAQAVADELVRVGYFDPSQGATVKVSRDHQRHIVALVVQDFAFTDAKLQDAFRKVARELSSKVFANEPVDLWLSDGELEPHVKLTSGER
jgi:hypothetical protein